jgi:hypothetical protein
LCERENSTVGSKGWLILDEENREKIYVWKCGSGGFLKYFSIKNILK